MKLEKKIWASDIVRTLAPQGKEKSTLVALAEHANADGSSCFVSIDRIARETGHSRRTVQRHIKELEATGQIRKGHQAHESRTNTYNIVCCEPARQIVMPIPPARDPDEVQEIRSPEVLALVRAAMDHLKMTGT